MGDDDFRALIHQARAGNGAAVERLLGLFEREVRMVVRIKLPRALRGQFDSMDFVQAVWQSVFASPDDPLAFSNPRHFQGYLAGVARHKVLEEYRRRTRSHKYNLSREEPLYVKRGDRDEPRDVPAPDPSPSKEAQAAECLDRLVNGRSPLEAQVVELRREGLTFEEIGQRLGLHERTVRRVVETLRARMEREEARRWP